jgi:hypothetical protein
MAATSTVPIRLRVNGPDYSQPKVAERLLIVGPRACGGRHAKNCTGLNMLT